MRTPVERLASYSVQMLARSAGWPPLRGISPCTRSLHAYRQLQPAERAHVRAVAYVKYDKASSAAAAIESMHEAVLNDGRGPMLKVLLAEAPNVRCRQGRLSSVTGSWAP